jgi:hypothetical protein
MNIKEMIIAQKQLSKKLKFLELFKSEDDYAIEFVEWIVKNCNHSKLKSLDYKQLLEIFKKEKGL